MNRLSGSLKISDKKTVAVAVAAIMAIALIIVLVLITTADDNDDKGGNNTIFTEGVTLGFESESKVSETTEAILMEFAEVDEFVTARGIAMLWEAPSEDSGIVHSIKHGEEVQRIGVSSEGWSKLLYKGYTVYAFSHQLMAYDSETGK